MSPIGIVSTSSDFHAHAVRERLAAQKQACYFIPIDSLSGKLNTYWDSRGGALRIATDVAGVHVDPRDLRSIWWRRAGGPQKFPNREPGAHAELIDTDTREALAGALLTSFSGTWVSSPYFTAQAENKLIQLHAAEQAGLQIPKTCITQDPLVVEEFAHYCSTGVIVKWVRGVRSMGVPAKELPADEIGRLHKQIGLAPAIYQAYVPGDKHLRINCFGSGPIVAAEIRSTKLDWRTNMNLSVRKTELPFDLEQQIRSLLSILKLEMGVMDMKISPDGEYYWLEVNPQGQFLFLEGLCPELNLLSTFCDFLTSC